MRGKANLPVKLLHPHLLECCFYSFITILKLIKSRFLLKNCLFHSIQNTVGEIENKTIYAPSSPFNKIVFFQRNFLVHFVHLTVFPHLLQALRLVINFLISFSPTVLLTFFASFCIFSILNQVFKHLLNDLI